MLASYLLIATAAINVFLAIVIINKRHKKTSDWAYSLMTLSISGWSFTMFFYRNAAFDDIIFWGKLVYLFAGAVPFFFLMFSIYFNEKRKIGRVIDLLVLLPFVVIIFLVLSGPFIISGASILNGVNALIYGFGNYFYAFYVLLFFSLGLAYLIRKARLNSGIIGAQLSLITVGATITLAISFVNNVVFTLLGDFRFNWIGPSSTLIMVCFIAYAITRYRLMDIKALISKSSIFALLVLIVSATFVLLSNTVTHVLSDYVNIKSAWVPGLFVGLIITLLFNPLKNLLERLTDRFLFIKTYKPSEVLSDVNNAAISEIDLMALLSTVSQRLRGVFFFKKIAFLFLDEKGKLQIVKQEGFDTKYMEVFAKGKEKVLPIYFSGNKNIWVIPELKTAYDSGEYQPKSLELLMGLYDMDVNLVIPLFVKDDVIGIVLVGDKKSDDLYTQDDINTLSAIAGQLAMAIENARLYEKQKRFNQDLKVEVKKATEKLVAANKELQRLDDAKSEFLSIASHQLRTPTTIIRGYISMMQEGSFGPVSPIIQDNLKKVNSATDRLLSLIESLLDISRMEAGRLEFDMQPTDLAAIAKGLIDDFKKKAEDKKLKLDFYFPKDLPKVSADPNKVKEVASNLIDNSIKYTPKGEVSVGLHQEGSSVVFSVQDTGLGVEAEDLPRLFNKFVRGKDMVRVHTEGTGLGLYFARVVIENMGGRIWAESPGKNQGSKFCFSLPLADKGKAKKVSTK